MSDFILKRKFPITANPQGTATGTLTKLGIGSDIYEIQGGGSTVTIDATGTASSSDARYQRVGIDGVYTEIDGTKYMETTSYTTPSTGVRRFTFSSNAIQSTGVFDFYADVFGVSPSAVTLDTTSATHSLAVDFNASDNVGKCRVYIRG